MCALLRCGYELFAQITSLLEEDDLYKLFASGSVALRHLMDHAVVKVSSPVGHFKKFPLWLFKLRNLRHIELFGREDNDSVNLYLPNWHFHLDQGLDKLTYLTLQCFSSFCVLRHRPTPLAQLFPSLLSLILHGAYDVLSEEDLEALPPLLETLSLESCARARTAILEATLLPELPSSLTWLTIQGAFLKDENVDFQKRGPFPPSLTYLGLDSTTGSFLEHLHEGMKVFKGVISRVSSKLTLKSSRLPRSLVTLVVGWAVAVELDAPLPPNLTELDASWDDRCNADLSSLQSLSSVNINLLPRLPNIKKLALEGSLHSLAWDRLPPNLKSLDLIDSLTPVPAKWLPRCLEALFCSSLVDNDINSLPPALKRLSLVNRISGPFADDIILPPSLTDLTTHAASLMVLQAGCSNLSSLSLKKLTLWDGRLSAFQDEAMLLDLPESIEELQLHFSREKGEYAASWIAHVKRFPKLRALEFTGSSALTSTIDTLLTSLPTSLCAFKLQCTGFSQGSLSLMPCRHLTTLDINEDAMPDDQGDRLTDAHFIGLPTSLTQLRITSLSAFTSKLIISIIPKTIPFLELPYALNDDLYKEYYSKNWNVYSVSQRAP